MLHVLNGVEEARREAEQLLAEGRVLGFPLALSHLAIQMMLRKRGLPIPADVLAWVSQGFTSDTMVENWESVNGA